MSESRTKFDVKTQISTGAWRGRALVGGGGGGGGGGRGEKERKDRQGMLRVR